MARDQILVQYKIGDAVSMLLLHTDRWDTFEIINRTPKSVVLRDDKGRTHFADILRLSDYNGACEVLDLPGYNAHFADGSLQQHSNDDGELETPKKGRPTRSEEYVNNVRKLAAQGKTQKAIAEALGKSISTVRNICKGHGIHANHSESESEQKLVEQLPAIKRMIADGCSVREIADACGASWHCVATFMAKRELATKPLQTVLGEDKVEIVTVWRKQGMTTAEICERLGVGKTTLRIFMIQNGIE